MKSDETVTYPGHTYAGRPCVGISLCSLCVPSSFGEKVGSEANRGCGFSQAILMTTTFMEGRTGASNANFRASCRQCFLPQHDGDYLVEMWAAARGIGASARGVGLLLLWSDGNCCLGGSLGQS